MNPIIVRLFPYSIIYNLLFLNSSMEIYIMIECDKHVTVCLLVMIKTKIKNMKYNKEM